MVLVSSNTEIMKNSNPILLILISFLFLCSFSKDVSYSGDGSSTPVLMKRVDFEKAIATDVAQELHNTSRISLKDNRIYVVELYKGVHVIDNTDPTQPNSDFHFITIPGCVDMSIKGDVLYARSAEDLVAVDISDITNVKEISRVKETFPELGADVEYYGLPYRFQKGQRPANTVIVAWEGANN